ncbi:DUF4325 domain-containing protein [Pseudoalteromonas sp. Z9A6]|uniref:STAS-like domain-containing protein n=1 Tax=Pseudoalteromonas sp. Z9A6 TaxID=2686352 RepID=UPI0013FE021E|nr:DUF4325 domain-containing protein [Pseudoalteromonas sp. Z9A6]
MLKKLSKDFSKIPFGRSKIDGKDNGTKFREKFLKNWVDECVKSDEQLTIELNDLDIPMTSSFMEESFGGLVRFGHANKEKLLAILNFKSDDESYTYEIIDYISKAEYDSEAKMYEM